MRKPGPPRDIPPPLELQCLRALWLLEEASVRDVRETVMHSRTLAYTTVMTILDRLARKGAVTRRKVGRSFVYVPVLSREALRRLAVRELVDSFFDGSEEALLRYLRDGVSAPADAQPAPAGNDLDTALL